VLRTLVRDYAIQPSTARDEGWKARSVALAPSHGALVRIRRR
jgi:cytochrome P450 family 138